MGVAGCADGVDHLVRVDKLAEALSRRLSMSKDKDIARRAISDMKDTAITGHMLMQRKDRIFVSGPQAEQAAKVLMIRLGRNAQRQIQREVQSD